ncbi:MAG: DUF445 family protein [Treponema sp.]|nr:DUF445 family protein [Treponema sp.]
MMNNILLYLAPPVIGAIIGYVTNAIAIKMLFRPLYPIKIGPFQLPFTPGILPRERHKLADNIGRMVERELLTEEIIRQRLSKPDVIQAVEQGVSSATEQLLDTKLQGSSDFAKEAIDFLVHTIHNPGFINALGSLLDNIAEDLQGRKISDLSGIEIDELQAKVQLLISQQLEQLLPAASSSIGSLLDSHYMELKDRLINFLRLPEIHEQLEVQGRIFLQKTFLKLNTFQRFFISAAQYDKTLDERMGDIIDDLIYQIDVLLSKEENKIMLVRYVQSFIADLGTKRETLYRLTGMLNGLIAPALHKELGDLVQSITGLDREAQRKVLRTRFQSWMQASSEEAIKASLLKYLNQHAESRIGEIVHIDMAQKAHIDGFIAHTLIDMAHRKIADALKMINIRSIVSDRIDSLDMESVERIVLDVMASQFKWINVFGAILGALIGAGQVVLSFFLKGLN